MKTDLATQRRLHILNIRRLLQPKPDHANRRRILIRSMQAPRHIQWFPLRAQPHPPRLTPTQRPPIPPGLLLRFQQILQPNARMSNDRVLQEIAIVDDLDGDDRGGTVGTEVLGGRFPNGLERVADFRRAVDGGRLRSNVDFAEGVEVGCVDFSGIEVFGLVHDEADDSDL